MPIHEFECQNCSYKFEIITLTSSQAESSENKQCPKCDSLDLKKLPGSFMWRFGGAGGDRNDRKDK
jgi:putative FmdB family regulatory protein